MPWEKYKIAKDKSQARHIIDQIMIKNEQVGNLQAAM